MKTFFTYALLKFSCVLFLISCIGYKPNSNFKRILNDSQRRASGKLNFEGAYLNHTETNYPSRGAMYFFKNGLVYSDNLGASQTYPLNSEKWFRRYLPEKTDWGTYEIIGDTINICVYYYYLDGNGIYRQTNFSGIIKNRDTILNWHMVEPYPKMDKQFTKKYTFLKLPRDLYFRPVTFKPFMDSVSEKAWVLKYRDKK